MVRWIDMSQQGPSIEYATRSTVHRPQRFATMALVVSVVSLFVPLMGIVAILMSRAARARTRQQGFVPAFRTRVALWLGVIALAMNVVGACILVRHQILEARRVRCSQNMSMILHAAVLYSNENRNAWPDVSTVLATQDLRPATCVCPYRTRVLPSERFTDDPTARREGKLDYVLVRDQYALSPRKSPYAAGARTGPYVAEPLRNHDHRGAHVLYESQPMFLNEAQALKLFGELKARFQITDEEYQYLIAK